MKEKDKRILELEAKIAMLVSDRDFNFKTYFEMGDKIRSLTQQLENLRDDNADVLVENIELKSKLMKME